MTYTVKFSRIKFGECYRGNERAGALALAEWREPNFLLRAAKIKEVGGSPPIVWYGLKTDIYVIVREKAMYKSIHNPK